MMTTFGLVNLVMLVVRLVVPFYLYNEANKINLPKSGWWIVFGLFEPVVAAIAFYVILYFRQFLKEAKSE